MADIPEGFVDITEEQNKGVFKKVVTEGAGDTKPQSGNVVSVHYVGTLYGGEKDGEQFDSSRDRGEYFEFTLGKGEVIKGWDTAVATMKKGELCEIICAPDYAYGSSGSGPTIGPNATLKFEIELFNWKGEDISPDKDKSIEKFILESGDGYTEPKDCSRVEVHIEGMYEGHVFDNRDVGFEIGDAEDNNIPTGIEIALKKMKKKEKCQINLQSKHGFGMKGKSEFNIPPNADLQYTIHLKNFEKLKEAWELKDNEDKFSQVEIVKTKGGDYFKQNKFNMAACYYEKITTYLQYEDDFLEEEDKKRRNSLIVIGYSNLALCYLKQKEFKSAIEQCEKALDIDTKCEKALFRKGQAQEGLQNYDEAVDCYKKVIEIDPNNAMAKKNINNCQLEIKKDKDREKNLYRNIFSKMSKPGKADTTGDEKKENGTIESQ